MVCIRNVFGYFRMDGPDGHRELIESGAFTQQLHTTLAGASLSDRARELESRTFSTGTRCVRVMVLICFDPPWLQLLLPFQGKVPFSWASAWQMMVVLSLFRWPCQSAGLGCGSCACNSRHGKMCLLHSPRCALFILVRSRGPVLKCSRRSR